MSFSYHYNLIYDDLKDAVENFSLNSNQMKIALKTSLSCVTAIFLANLFKLNMPFWSGITTLVIMRANVGASFTKGWMRTGGCTIGCILCIFFFGYIVQNSWLFSIFLFLGIFLAFYTGNRAEHGYFWSYMLANMALIGMVALSNPYGSFPLHIAYYRAAEIFLGVVVSWVYNIVLWPNYAGNRFQDLFTNLISDILSFHSLLIDYYCSSEKEFHTLAEKFDKIKLELKKCRSMLSDVNSENFLLRKDKSDAGAILDLIENRLTGLENIIEHFSQTNENVFPEEYGEFLSQISRIMNKLSINENFKSNSFFKMIPDDKELRKEIENNYNVDSFRKYKGADILFFYEFIYYFEAFCKDLKRVSSGNMICYNKEKVSVDNSDFICFNVFGINLEFYKPSLKNAFKGGIAILVIFWICLWLQIPGGYANMTVAIIAVLGPQLDTLASKHKGILRFFGCLTGAALGLSFLLINTDSTYIYFTTIFCVTSVTSYIFGAKPGVAYIGLQTGIAFLVCVADGFAPVVSIDSVIERLTGIFLAVLLMWLINYIIWPDNMIGDLKRKLDFITKELKVKIEKLKIKVTGNSTENFYVSSAIKTNDISSILETIRGSEELQEETLHNIKMFVMYFDKISKKIFALSNTPEYVVSFLQADYKAFLKSTVDVVYSVVENSFQSANIKELGNSVNKQINELDSIIQDIRLKGSMVEKDIRFKQDVAWFILMLKRILYDAGKLNGIRIDIEYQRLKNEI